MSSAAEKKEELSINEKIADFIQRNRKGIFTGIILAVILLVVFIAALIIRDKLTVKAVSTVEELNNRYEALRLDINDTSREAEVNALLEELGTFAAKNSGYAGVRSYLIMADMQADMKKWADAEQTWIKAGEKAAKSYLAPVAYYNAAIAAEEQDKLPYAIELYTKSLGLREDFPGAARAQFAIGRLEESQNNHEAAVEAYRAVINNWPAETIWTNLAHSKIIYLSNKK
ncbi:MAG: tetratricopeptide repeat protein [Treponema sp.]|jgi:tetratricopeptide (TPR) repeat protein|nr:tetratricopeptide repeat protein [Treponema sp.]